MKSQNTDATLKTDFTIRGAALSRLSVFVSVAERRSFTAGAQAAGMSPSAASQAIARLEEDAGVKLFVRTTRSVSLTDAGVRLLAEAKPALELAYAALSAVTSHRDVPSGILKLNVPRIASRLGLPSVLTDYTQKHPEVRVDVVVDDRQVNLVRDGFDAGIRSREAIHKDMIRVRISAPARFVVVGSKRYFALHGRPQHPRELVNHICLGWRSLAGGGEYRWEFTEGVRDYEVVVSGPIVSNDTDLLIACALQGLGLAFVVEAEVERQIATGKLQTALLDYAIEVPGLFLYFPRDARHVPKVRAFAECARQATRAKTTKREAP